MITYPERHLQAISLATYKSFQRNVHSISEV